MEDERARFFGMIACIDENLAQLRQRLEQWGIEENTILVFMTDNGHSGYKMPATSKFAFNAGMRGFKTSQYDGGHRVPCFVRWPAGGIKGGRDVPQIAAHIDLLPTLVELCGLQFEPKQPLDGMSLAPLLKGNNGPWPDRTLLVHHQRLETPIKGRNWSAMTDRWRLVDGKELYDIHADPGQRQNVSQAHPEVVQRLQAAYEGWWSSISTRFDEFCPVVVGATAENPVEYNLSGINQCEVKERIGLTFGLILRSMLRQAPNIILVGEIRDLTVAEVAIQAALTGHLVFSTLHTNDAPSAITRLIDMGVKPFLVASSVQAIMAQRLIRIICSECKEVDPDPDPRILHLLGFTDEELKSGNIYRGKGCAACQGTGYHGRKGIFELMEMNSAVSELAINRESLTEIRKQARAAGMRTLLEDGRQKILNGITTPGELVRATQVSELSSE